jgi:hypothetical protein
LCGGFLTQALQRTSLTPVASYRAVVLLYAALGLLLAFLFTRLSVLVEVGAVPSRSVSSAGIADIFGITRSRNVVLKLSSLFALDSFAGGFVVQSFAAYWFYLRFGVEPATLGAIFFWANVFAGISVLVASRLAGRIGLVRTMVFTHLPSNILLILVPLTSKRLYRTRAELPLPFTPHRERASVKALIWNDLSTTKNCFLSFSSSSSVEGSASRGRDGYCDG